MATKTKKATSIKVEKKTMMCKNSCSKKEKAIGQFYKSNLEEYQVYGGYAPYCKSCLRKMSVDVSVNTVTMESIKDTLKRVDKPLIEELFILVKNKSGMTNEKFLGDYIKLINCYPEYKLLVYADSVDIKIQQEKIMNSKVDEVVKQEVTDEMILFWGRNANLANQDYLDLQTKFNGYIKYENSLDPKKEQDYRQLCIYELQRDKMQYNIDKESVNVVKTYQTMINELSDNLGIQAVQKRDEQASEKLILGLVARYIEDVKKRPIKRYVEDFGGEDKIRELVGVEYVGAMLDSIGAKNPNKQKYEELMKPYTVQPEDLLVVDDGDK